MYSWEFWFATEVSGSGDVASGVAVAGQASETFAAAGAVATPSVAIAGSGAQVFVGIGAVATASVGISGTAGAITSVGGAPAFFIPAPEGAIIEDDQRREKRRRQQREKVRAEAQAVITVAMATVLNHQRRIEEDDWLLGLADDYVRRAA